MADPEFQERLAHLQKTYTGRPTPVSYAGRLSEQLGGAQIYLKREDLAHTGAHKINNALGQALLAQRMGKKRIVAETGAGQHGVASATASALLGLDCHVYMGTVDIARQQPNVFRMKLLGAEVIPVESGSKTLKDAINEAIRDWVTNVETTFYLLGSALGPHPYPMMVRDFQSVIGTRGAGANPRTGGAAAGCVHRLRRRRQQRDWLVSRLPRRRERRADRRRGGRPRHRGRRTRRALRRSGAGAPGRAARHALVCAAKRGRADFEHAQHLGRAGLRLGGAGTRLSARRASAPSTPTPPTTRRSTRCKR